MSDSSNLYRLRKKRIYDSPHPPREFQEATLPYHSRPHSTIPELQEDYPEVWVPIVPVPTRVCDWDDPDAIWDDTFYFDCED